MRLRQFMHWFGKRIHKKNHNILDISFQFIATFGDDCNITSVLKKSHGRFFLPEQKETIVKVTNILFVNSINKPFICVKKYVKIDNWLRVQNF